MTRVLLTVRRVQRVLGPVAFWKFNEGSGTATFDSSGNGSTGVATAGVSRVAGKHGGAVSLASLSTITVTDNPEFHRLHGNFTISAWVKSTQAAASGTFPLIVRRRDTGAGYGWELVFHESTAAPWYFALFIASTEYDCRATSDAADGSWHHLLVTRRGDTLTAYHDGVSEGTKTVPTTLATNTDSAVFGRASTSLTYIGDLDSVRFYNRVLSQTEITALANEY